MRLLFLFLLVTPFIASSQRSWRPNKAVQCTLLKWEFEKRYRARLTTISSHGDTMVLLYGWKGLGQPKFYGGMKMTVEYDTTACMGCAPGTVVKSRITFNK